MGHVHRDPMTESRDDSSRNRGQIQGPRAVVVVVLVKVAMGEEEEQEDKDGKEGEDDKKRKRHMINIVYRAGHSLLHALCAP